MFETILELAIPATQGLLIFALFGVAFLFVRLDGKLNAMKKGTDGIRQTIIELNTALAQAQKAMADLKTASDQTSAQLAKKIDEANAAKEALGFASSAAKAIKSELPLRDEYAPRYADERQPNNANQYQNQRRGRLDDLPSFNEKRRTEWGGLR